MRAKRYFEITITYREPSYEKRAGAKPEPYRFVQYVEAPDTDRAVTAALTEFRKLELDSGVGWGRELQRIDVAPIDSPPRVDVHAGDIPIGYRAD